MSLMDELMSAGVNSKEFLGNSMKHEDLPAANNIKDSSFSHSISEDFTIDFTDMTNIHPGIKCQDPLSNVNTTNQNSSDMFENSTMNLEKELSPFSNFPSSPMMTHSEKCKGSSFECDSLNNISQDYMSQLPGQTINQEEVITRMPNTILSLEEELSLASLKPNICGVGEVNDSTNIKDPEETNIENHDDSLNNCDNGISESKTERSCDITTNNSDTDYKSNASNNNVAMSEHSADAVLENNTINYINSINKSNCCVNDSDNNGVEDSDINSNAAIFVDHEDGNGNNIMDINCSSEGSQVSGNNLANDKSGGNVGSSSRNHLHCKIGVETNSAQTTENSLENHLVDMENIKPDVDMLVFSSTTDMDEENSESLFTKFSSEIKITMTEHSDRIDTDIDMTDPYFPSKDGKGDIKKFDSHRAYTNVNMTKTYSPNNSVIDMEITKLCSPNKTAIDMDLTKTYSPNKTAIDMDLTKTYSSNKTAIDMDMSKLCSPNKTATDEDMTKLCSPNKTASIEDMTKLCSPNKTATIEDMTKLCSPNKTATIEDMTKLCSPNKTATIEDMTKLCSPNKTATIEEITKLCSPNKTATGEEITKLCSPNKTATGEDMTKLCSPNKTATGEMTKICSPNKTATIEDMTKLCSPNKTATIEDMTKLCSPIKTATIEMTKLYSPNKTATIEDMTKLCSPNKTATGEEMTKICSPNKTATIEDMTKLCSPNKTATGEMTKLCSPNKTATGEDMTKLCSPNKTATIEEMTKLCSPNNIDTNRDVTTSMIATGYPADNGTVKEAVDDDVSSLDFDADNATESEQLSLDSQLHGCETFEDLYTFQKTKLLESEKKVRSLTKELDDQEKVIQKAVNLGKQLLEENVDLKTNVDNLEQKLSNIDEELKNEKHATKLKIETKEYMEKQYSEEINLLQNEVTQLKDEVQNLQKQEAHLNRELRNKDYSLEQSSLKEEQLTSTIKNLEKLLLEKSEEVAHDNTSKSFSGGNDQQLIVLEKEITDLHTECTTLKSQLISNHANTNRLEEELLRVKRRLAEKEQEYEEIRSEMNSYEKTLGISQREILDLKAQLYAAQVENMNRQDRGNSLFSEVEDRRISAEKMLKSIQENYQILKEKYNLEKQQNYKLKIQTMSLYQMNSSKGSETEVEYLNTKLTQSQQQVKQLQEKVKSMEKLEVQHNDKLIDIQKAFGTKENQDLIDFLNTVNDKKQKELQAIQEKMNNLEMQYIQETGKVVSYMKKLRLAEEKAESLGYSNMKLKLQIDELLIKYKPDKMEEDKNCRKTKTEKIPLSYSENIPDNLKSQKENTKPAPKPVGETNQLKANRRKLDLARSGFINPLDFLDGSPKAKKTVCMAADVEIIDCEGNKEQKCMSTSPTISQQKRTKSKGKAASRHKVIEVKAPTDDNGVECAQQ
ncbi:protein Spindly-like [Argonauta hians]